jgi:hypothetical protein
MAKTILENIISFETVKDFEKAILNGDFRISRFIVETIFKNLDTTKKNIWVFSFNIEETNEICDFSIERKNFIELLEKNLKFYEREEYYEICLLMQQTITKLKENES